MAHDQTDYDDHVCLEFYTAYSNAESMASAQWFGQYNFSFITFELTFDSSKGLLHPYMKNGAILRCPSVRGEDETGSVKEVNEIGYGLNWVYLYHPTYAGDGSGPWVVEPPNPVSTSVMDNPAETILMGDCARLIPFVGGYNEYHTFREYYPPSLGVPTGKGRHSNRANVAWLDGHVKSFNVSAPPDGTYYATQEEFESYQLGDILKQPHTGIGSVDDYYYSMKK